MTTTLEAFVLELGIDPKNFTEGQKKVWESWKKTKAGLLQDADDVERRSKLAMEFATKLRNQIILLYGAFTAGKGLGDFAESITQIDANLGRLAFTLDTTGTMLGTWNGAGATVGATAEDISGSIKNLVMQFQQFSVTGQSSVIPYIRGLGVSIVDAYGKMRPMQNILFDIADRFQHMDPARAAFFGSQIGLSPGMVNLLLLGRGELQRRLREAAKYAPTADDLKRAREMQYNFSLLELASQRLGITLMTQLTPALNGLANVLKNVGDWLQAHPDALDLIAGGLAAIGTVLTVGLSYSVFAAAISGFSALSAAIFATPVGWIILGLGAITLAGYEFVKHWREIAGWWHDLWAGMRGDATLDQKKKAEAAAQVLNPMGIGDKMLDWIFGAAPGAKPVARGAGLPPEATRFLGTIAGPESGGAYNVTYGGGRFSSYAAHPNRANLITRGPNAGRYSTAAGRYQLLYGTWMQAANALGLKDFSPANQDRAAWWIAQRDYRAHTGRDLLADLRSGDPRAAARIASALSGTWTSLPGGAESQESLTRFAGLLSASRAQSVVNKGGVRHGDKNINVGQVTVVTQASDADAIARSILEALERQNFAAQGDFGPQ